MVTATAIKTSGTIKGTPPTGEHWEKIKAACEPYGVPGRDHESMLRYCQHLAANFAGILNDDANGQRVRYVHREGWSPKYGTRYWDGSVEPNHDDHDCLYDLEALGLVKTKGTGLNPIVFMTPKGTALVGELETIIQEWRLKQPRIEKPDPEIQRRKDAEESQRQADMMMKRMLAQRRKDEANRRRRLTRAQRKAEDKRAADRIRFAGSVEVTPDDLHPSK